MDELPDSIGYLSHLHTLNLTKNYLTSLPASIGNLTNLKFLWFANNPIIEIPSSITNLNLQTIDSGTNNILKQNGYQYNFNTNKIVPYHPFNFSRPLNSSQSTQQTTQDTTSNEQQTIRTQPLNSTRNTQQSPEEKYDITCQNEDDILYLDDFTKGPQEYSEANRVIILNEGRSKEGTCFGRSNLIKQ